METFGSPAIKPTTLRLMGLPHSARVFHGEALQGLTKPQTSLEGVDPTTGKFRTACAKEYPSGLCRALVVTLLHGLADRRRREGVQVTPLSQLEERDVQWLRTVVDCSSSRYSATTCAVPCTVN